MFSPKSLPPVTNEGPLSFDRGQRKELTPERHKDREEHSWVIVKEVSDFWEETWVVEFPIITVVITDWAHGQVTDTLFITNLETEIKQAMISLQGIADF